MNTKLKKILKWAGTGIGLLGGALFLAAISNGADEDYSNSWLSSASDEELDVEREIVRLRHCSGDESAWNTLHRFDEEICKRAWDGNEYGYPAHREHGWHLSNDD